jgi:hypothetical protein
MKVARIKDKITAGKELREKEREFLKTLGKELISMEVLTAIKERKTGRPREYHTDRPANAKERVAAMRARRKEIEEQQKNIKN